MISKPLLKTRCMFGTTIPCFGWTFGNFNMFGKLSNIWIFELLVNFGKNEVSKKSAVPFKYFSSCLKKWSLELGKYTKIHSEHSTCLLNLHNTFIWNTFNLSLWWLLIGGLVLVSLRQFSEIWITQLVQKFVPVHVLTRGPLSALFTRISR